MLQLHSSQSNGASLDALRFTGARHYRMRVLQLVSKVDIFLYANRPSYGMFAPVSEDHMRLGSTFRSALHSVGIHHWPKKIHGSRVWLPIDGFNASDLLSLGSFADFEGNYFRALLGKITNSDIVFDIGAHRGVFSAVAAPLCSHLYAFEPSEKNCTYLKDTLRRNGIGNATVIPKGIGPNEEKVPFWEHGAGSSTVCHDPRFSVRTTAEMMRLDNCEPDPDVVKIDVEGAEAVVISSSEEKLRSTRIIGVEVHPEKLPSFGSSESDVLAALRGVGFSDPYEEFETERSVYMLIASKQS